MRHQWRRLLLLRAHLRYPPHVFSHSPYSQVNSQSNPHFFSVFTFTYPINPISRSLSSKPAALETTHPDDLRLIAQIFSGYGVDLESSNEFDRDSVLKSLESSPDVARKVFDWLCRRRTWNSKWCNQMLFILGVNGDVREFWKLFYVMKNKKGYGVEGWVRDRVLEEFEKNGLDNDAEMLRAVSIDSSVMKLCSKVCKIVRKEVWSDIERQLRELNVAFSSDVVKMVVELLKSEPKKALMFFRWVEEAGFLKHDQQTYNAAVRMLGRKNCLDMFREVVQEMRSNGCELELKTYVEVVSRFCRNVVIQDAVDLYEFAMAGANKPSVACTTFLLTKIVVGKKLDMDLFLRVVRIYREGGNAVTSSMLNAVIKSLISVGRLGECDEIVKVMDEGGLVAGAGTGLINITVQALGTDPDCKVWSSLIKGYCVAGDLEKASHCFRKMIESEGVDSAGSDFELVVKAYCRDNRAVDAFKFLSDLVSQRQLKPRQKTYRLLISKLLAQGEFRDALHIRGLMKTDGWPPIIYSFIEHILKSGTGDDAIDCLRKMIESEGVASAGFCFKLVVEALCRKKRATDASKFLSNLVSQKQLKPWKITYKLLISKLLSQGEFRDALHILGVMKNDGFPLIIDPFIKHVSKSGTGDDATACPKTVASREFPSTVVFLQVFAAYFKAGLCSKAQERYIHNHADVLNLFCPLKSGEDAAIDVVSE